MPSSPPESYAHKSSDREATHSPFSRRFTFETPVNQSGLGAIIATRERSGWFASTRTVATSESPKLRSGPLSTNEVAAPDSIALRISLSRGACLPSSDSFSSPAVGREPTVKIAYDELCAAPIKPEKCGPVNVPASGYSSGNRALVHELLSTMVYSTLSDMAFMLLIPLMLPMLPESLACPVRLMPLSFLLQAAAISTADARATNRHVLCNIC